MTQKEMELRISNLEKNIMALAEKQYSRATQNEEKCQKNEIDISTTNTKTEENRESIAELNDQLSLADETAIELYELQMQQEEINNVQDESLIEIYEMLGGE